MTVVSGVFLVSSLVVIVTPGPDAALLSHLVLDSGRRLPGLAAAAGMITAGTAYATLGAVGITQILAHHPGYLTVLRWLGTIVLLAWGAAMLWDTARAPHPAGPVREPPPRRAAPYWQGLLCTGSNPKVGLFLLAFLPQFVPRDVSPGPAITLLAVVYLSLGLLWLVTLTELVYRVRGWLKRPRLLCRIQAATALLFICFAVRAALGA